MNVCAAELGCSIVSFRAVVSFRADRSLTSLYQEQRELRSGCDLAARS